MIANMDSSTTAGAYMRYPIKLEDCTWEQVETALDEGYTTAVIACAGMQQPAACIAEALALRVARRLGNAFMAPPLCADGAALTPALADTCVSLSRRGFQYLVVLPTSMHPFTVSAVTDGVQARIYEAELPGLVITYGDLLQRQHWQKDFLMETTGCTREEAAGLAETALLLALQPELAPMRSTAPDTVSVTPETGAALLDYLGAEMAKEIHERMLCRR
jgi:creatinine amidohydrolase